MDKLLAASFIDMMRNLGHFRNHCGMKENQTICLIQSSTIAEDMECIDQWWLPRHNERTWLESASYQS